MTVWRCIEEIKLVFFCFFFIDPATTGIYTLSLHAALPISFTYRVEADIDAEKIVPKDDEIEEARWFSKAGALQVAVSFFDIEAIEKHL